MSFTLDEHGATAEGDELRPRLRRRRRFQDRIYVSGDALRMPASSCFDRDGKILETWTKEVKDKLGYDQNQYVATAHGLYWNKEGDHEFLYWTENVAQPKGAPKIGAARLQDRFDRQDPLSDRQRREGNGNAQKFDFTNPTDVAVAANGDIYVVDGYGSQLVHRFDKNFKLIKTIGGRGKENGKFNTCHGIWVSTLEEGAGNLHRGPAQRPHPGFLDGPGVQAHPSRRLRNPCCFYQYDGHLYIPDLAARLTVIDAKDKVVAQLGDSLALRARRKDIVRAEHPVRHSAFPHALTLDSKGDIYVVEWSAEPGRARKLKRNT